MSEEKREITMTISMKEKVTKYLTEKYDPKAMILHGSRAREKAGENSDWDIFLLTEEEKDITPEQFEEESLDIQAITLPVTEDEILDTFGSQLIQAEILYDSNDTAAELIAKAEKLYEGGRELTEQEIENRKNYLLRYLHRLTDRNENEGVFFWYTGIFYGKSIQYWFEVKENRWSEPIYVALDIIESEDPEYFSRLQTLYSSQSVDERIEAAENIFRVLFD